MRAFITGIAGFAGSHLADHLLTQEGVEVFGLSLPTDRTHNLDHILSRVALHLVDLADYTAVHQLFDEIRPDLVFHLAAQASVGRSWQNPAETLVNNATAQANLLRAIVELDLHPRILVVGSADEYGAILPEDLPVDETTPLRPLNPYAVSKVTQDFLGLQYHLSHGLHVIRVRPFNHAGPRQNPGFVVPDFSKQVAEIEAGLVAPVMYVGDLTARRDFSDVRDMVRAYDLALKLGKPGEVYNLGSGQAYAISDVLDMLLSFSHVQVRVEQDPSRLRPSDIREIVCDGSRFQADTGWQPRYTLQQTLLDVLDDWRQRVRAAGRA